MCALHKGPNESGERARNDAHKRAVRGLLAYQSGYNAERLVKQDYIARGYELLEQRWRGRAGEIDLIFKTAQMFVFVEVKSASSLERAAQSLSARQLMRIFASAEDYVAQSSTGLLADMRIDAAFVDQRGVLDVIENVSV